MHQSMPSTWGRHFTRAELNQTQEQFHHPPQVLREELSFNYFLSLLQMHPENEQYILL